MSVKIAFNGPRHASVRNVVIEFGSGGSFSIMRIPETELNTLARYDRWARRHETLGRELVDALWKFLRAEYGW